MVTGEVVKVAVEVLEPYISETMARSAIEAHCRKLGIAEGPISSEQLEQLLARLAGGLDIFVGREKSTALISEIRSALVARGDA
jgi:hypothetical protein